MATSELRLHGISVTRDRLDPDTRRREPVTPQAVLTLLPAQGRGAIREVKLSRRDLVTLIEEAAVSLRRLDDEP